LPIDAAKPALHDAMAMAQEVFISLTAQDTPIAEALAEALQEIFGETLQSHFSTSKQLGSGIGAGEIWFRWITERIERCVAVLVLVTPVSVNKPWILWEAGAVAGATFATSGQTLSLSRVMPLIFQVPPEMVPSPLQASQVQFTQGDQAESFGFLLDQLLSRLLPELPNHRVAEFGRKKDAVVRRYLERVQRFLRNAPAVASAAMIEVWLQRLDDLRRENRASEVGQLRDWMDLSLGRAGETLPPLDLRVHTRLADLYLRAKQPRQAIEQLDLALQLAPRDIFVLRQLGRAHLDDGNRASAKEAIDRIDDLSPQAHARSPECAALAARWHGEGGDHAAAAKVLQPALANNPNSHYLANLLAEQQLQAGQAADAAQTYRRALAIVAQLEEQNVWALATQANAQFFFGNDAQSAAILARIHALDESSGTWASIRRGLDKVAVAVPDGPSRLIALLERNKQP
jgi:tetratricopeptide (TPR) repeat protein